MATLYPTGYATARVALDELKRLYSGGMEPEYARRVFTWIASKNGAVGIGSAWRPNPSNVSQASKLGRSFHQTQNFKDGSRLFCAVDLVVPTKGGGHSSGAVPIGLVPLQRSAEAKRWGLHVNVGTPGKPGFESWHMQPIEIDGWQSWANNGRRRPDVDRDLPGEPEVVVQPPDEGGMLPPFAPEFNEYGLYPLAKSKEEIHGQFAPQPHDLIRYLQAVMRNQCKLSVAIDGYFGKQTQSCLKQLKKWNGLTDDGRCCTDTWACVDAYAAV